MMTTRPLCEHCSQPIKPCAPCCRHSGWIHKAGGEHLCDPKDPMGKMAFPERILLNVRNQSLPGRSTR